MTQVVTVQTEFSDLNQMAQGLVERVDETRVILPGPDRVDEGEWVQFAVNLVDGTPGFAGVGRCVTAVDNGDERPAEMRFDLVIYSLQFDQRGQDVYQHILLSRQQLIQQAGGAEEAPAPDYEDEENEPTVIGDSLELSEPPAEDAGYAPVAAATTTDPYTGEAPAAEMVGMDEVSEVASDEVEFSPDVLQPADSDTGEVATHDLDFEDLAAAGEPPGEAPSEYGEAYGEAYGAEPVADAALQAQPDGMGAVDAMDSDPTNPPPAPSTAAFVYPDGLPFPAVPPRPDLNPALAVSPAPRPGGDHAAEAEAPGEAEVEPELQPDAGLDFAGEGEPADEPIEELAAEEPAQADAQDEALAALDEFTAEAADHSQDNGIAADAGAEEVSFADEHGAEDALGDSLEDAVDSGDDPLAALDAEGEPTMIADEGFTQALESDPDSEPPPPSLLEEQSEKLP